jgi:hypothetical protein
VVVVLGLNLYVVVVLSFSLLSFEVVRREDIRKLAWPKFCSFAYFLPSPVSSADLAVPPLQLALHYSRKLDWKRLCSKSCAEWERNVSVYRKNPTLTRL